MYSIVITAGGTSEKIDNVRKITNSSTGKLGTVIANRMIENKGDRIDKIYFVCSKSSLRPINEKVEVIEIVDTNDLKNTVKKLLTEKQIDCFIHSMAVADYTVDFVTTAEELARSIDNSDRTALSTICNPESKLVDDKISSSYENLIIKLKKTPKIISMIKDISPRTKLVGFKLLDTVSEEQLIAVGLELKDKNKCDMVVANDLNNIRQGNHKAVIIRGKGDYIMAAGKEDIADKIIKEIM